MSWRASGWAKTTRGHKSSSQKLVLLILADYYDDERGYAWPSQKQLASDCEMPIRTVQWSLKVLEDHGFIAMLQKGNQYQPTHYGLNLIADAYAYEPAISEPAISEPAMVASTKVNPQPDASEPATPCITSLQEPTVIKEEEGKPSFKKVWPEWFALGFGLKGWIVDVAVAEKWRIDSGFSDEYCLNQIYVVRGWWTKTHEKNGRNPYSTFQRACREHWGGQHDNSRQKDPALKGL